MSKGLFKHALVGALAGIAANYGIAICASYGLNLGYFMACPASLPERVGGEMNAVALLFLLSALLGAGLNAAGHILRRRQGSPAKRIARAAACLISFLVPAAALAACMMK